MQFPPGYCPHNVKILYKGKKFSLVPETEEVANFWAQVKDSDFAENEKAKENFVSVVVPLFKKHHGDKLEEGFTFDDFDFSAIKDHLDSEREKRNARSKEEKQAETEKNKEIANFYNYCLFDKGVEKTANNLVEPPGIFRGRGEHPSIGLLKQRIMPEMVTINIGQDDLIPICTVPGHAWKRVY